MSIRFPVRMPALLAFVLSAAGAAAHAQSPSASLASPAPGSAATAPSRPSIAIQSPGAGEMVRGVAIIRFHTENVSIESPFLPKEMRRSTLPAAHLHVTVDGAAWHWVHSTTDPVVVTPLSAGSHTVTLELAGADHGPLDARTVRFTVAGEAAVRPGHAGHR